MNANEYRFSVCRNKSRIAGPANTYVNDGWRVVNPDGSSQAKTYTTREAAQERADRCNEVTTPSQRKNWGR